ncbi:hypothetical protein [Sphingobacterium siyangense]
MKESAYTKYEQGETKIPIFLLYALQFLYC